MEIKLSSIGKALRRKPILRKNGFASVKIGELIFRRLAVIGKTYWFEYHCYEGHDSSDAKLWYHSHQQVKVLGFADCDCPLPTFAERCEAGIPLLYQVQFADGLKWDVFEDELMTTRNQFSRPNPPKEP